MNSFELIGAESIPLQDGVAQVEGVKNPGREQVTFFEETFVPPRDNRNRIIRKRKKILAPTSTWLGREENEGHVVEVPICTEINNIEAEEKPGSIQENSSDFLSFDLDGGSTAAPKQRIPSKLNVPVVPHLVEGDELLISRSSSPSVMSSEVMRNIPIGDPKRRLDKSGTKTRKRRKLSDGGHEDHIHNSSTEYHPETRIFQNFIGNHI